MHSRPIELLAAVLLVGIVAACSNDDTSDTAPQDTAATAEPTSSTPPTTEPLTSATTAEPADRPPVVRGQIPMAFDEHSGVVVALVDDEAPGTRTWIFDVVAGTWSERASVDLSGPWVRAAYDPDTDLTVAIQGDRNPLTTYVYDVDADEWTRRSPPPDSGFPGVAAYDRGTDRVVVLGEEVWSYSVPDDRWTEIPQSEEGRPVDLTPLLVAYAASIDALVTFTGSNPGPSGNYEPAVTSVFEPATGTWTRMATDTPTLRFVGGDLSAGTEMVYAPVTDRVIAFGDGVTAEYDPVGGLWATFDAPGLEWIGVDTPEGPLARFGASLVYDTIGERVLLYGGAARLADGWTLLDDLWAYDPTTHEWSTVLEPTQSDVIIGS